MPKVTISTKSTSAQEAKKLFRELAKQTTPEASLDELMTELCHFEKKFGMSSIEFYRQFLAGKMGDEHNMMLWAMYYESYISLLQTRFLPKVIQK
jgi:hypothetical protein